MLGSPNFGAAGVRHDAIRQRFSRFRRNEDGATAIEFAIVVVPFMMFMFGIMVVGLQYFMQSNLEYAVEAASRQIRTGQAQTAGMTMGQFKQNVCDFSADFVDCDADLVVHVQSGANWDDPGMVPTPCVTNGALSPPTAGDGDLLSDSSGGQSVSVLVTACYRWELATMLWNTIHQLASAMNGGRPVPWTSLTVHQAAFTFKTEPYGAGGAGP